MNYIQSLLAGVLFLVALPLSSGALAKDRFLPQGTKRAPIALSSNQQAALVKMGFNSKSCGLSSIESQVLRSKRESAIGEEAPKMTIINGQQASEGQFPWIVSLQSKGEHVCGGSIVSKCHVETAAHCISEKVGTEMYNL